MTSQVKKEPVVSQERIEQLIREMPEVLEILYEIADDFVEKTTRFGLKLAKHRSSDTLTPKDISIALDKLYGLSRRKNVESLHW